MLGSGQEVGLRVCEGVYPTQGGYNTLGTLTKQIDSSITNSDGFEHVYIDSSGDPLVAYANGGSNGLSWSTLTGRATPEGTPEYWNFCSWGSDCLAVSIDNPLNFAAAGEVWAGVTYSYANPRARYIEILGNHVVLANIYLTTAHNALSATTYYPQMVWWSATDDPVAYSDPSTDPILNSDYQQLLSVPGPITAIKKVGDDAIAIFKTGGIEMMVRTGGPDLFAFQTLAVGDQFGTRWNASVCTVGRDLFFINAYGQLMVSQNMTQPKLVGGGKLYNTVLEPANSGLNLLHWYRTTDAWAFKDFVLRYDPTINCLILLTGHSIDNDGDTKRTVQFYNVMTNEWSRIGDIGMIWGDMTSWSGFSSAGDRAPNGSLIQDLNGDLHAFTGADNIAWELETWPTPVQQASADGVQVAVKQQAIRRIKPVWNMMSLDGVRDLDPAVYPTISIEAADDFTMANSQTKTMDETYRDNEGWYTLPGGRIAGSNFIFNISGEATDGRIQGLHGLLVDYVEAGVA